MRALTWQGVEEWLAEHAQVDLREDGVMAAGVQLGVEPDPYLLEYHLEAPSGWITRRLEVEAREAMLAAEPGSPAAIAYHQRIMAVRAINADLIRLVDDPKMLRLAAERRRRFSQ